MNEFNYKAIFSKVPKKTMKYSEFLEDFLAKPKKHLYTSTSIIAEAIKHFGYTIVIRSGEPVISYNAFKDPFTDGVNSIFGQEFSIDRITNVIEVSDKEAYPQRGIVLVGPPSSGKTNIVDMILKAIEEFSKIEKVKIYKFNFVFKTDDEEKKAVTLTTTFNHNPILLLPVNERNEFLAEVQERLKKEVPNFYKHSSLDKLTLDLIEDLSVSERNKNLSYLELLEEYIQVEELDFSIAQAKGIANIDDMTSLKARELQVSLNNNHLSVIEEHLPSRHFFKYTGSLVSANRGAIHIHDAFNRQTSKEAYRPLLMLLGSGKIAVSDTQSPIDTSVFVTTNLEEMTALEEELTSGKLLDRIEKIPVNYLLDANAEMAILERDLTAVKESYDIDPNLLRIASYYSVLTRLFPTDIDNASFVKKWTPAKAKFFEQITPEQKLFIYSCVANDPIKTIKELPVWHPFRNECVKLGVDLKDESTYENLIEKSKFAIPLEKSGVIKDSDLELIDDEFMRFLYKENYPEEGKYGMSVRQMQNVMRDTIASSDGYKVTVQQLVTKLDEIISDEKGIHYWLEDKTVASKPNSKKGARKIANIHLDEGEGDFGCYDGMLRVVVGIYHHIIKQEITICTVDRDPELIELDLRKYVQHCLLESAIGNNKFGKAMLEKHSYVDPDLGHKVDGPDYDFIKSMERVLNDGTGESRFRKGITDKYNNSTDEGKLRMKDSSLIFSKNDGFQDCFITEYQKLLSHKVTNSSVSADLLVEAFYQKMNDVVKYENYKEEVKDLVEQIIGNMKEKYGYSEAVALETIVYAIDGENKVVDFKEIIN